MAWGLSKASASSAGASSKRLRRFGCGVLSTSAPSATGSSAGLASAGVSARSKASASSIVSAGGSSVAVSAAVSPCTVFGSHGSSTEEAGSSAGPGWAAAAGSPEVVAAVPGSSSEVGLSDSGVVSTRVFTSRVGGTGIAMGRSVLTGPSSLSMTSEAGVGTPITDPPSMTVPSKAMPVSADDSPWQGSHAQSPASIATSSTTVPASMTDPSWMMVPSWTTVPASTIDPSTGPVVIHESRTTSAGGAAKTANGEGAPSGRSSMTIAPAQPGNGPPAPHGGGNAGPQATGMA